MKTNVWKEYGLKKPSYVRYKGRKGVYWYLFSIAIRKRDFSRYGACVSCGKPLKSWQEGQAGHFIFANRGGFGLLFNPLNVNLQCAKCNNPRFSPNASLPYAWELERRYGQGTATALFAAQGHVKEWNQKQYDAKIRELLSQ